MQNQVVLKRASWDEMGAVRGGQLNWTRAVGVERSMSLKVTEDTEGLVLGGCSFIGSANIS